MSNKTRAERFEIARTVMSRVEDSRFNIRFWKSTEDESTTETKAKECGTVACFAGWLAFSPEWQELGGSVGKWVGIPVFDKCHGSDAIAKFLLITDQDALALVAPFHTANIVPKYHFYPGVWGIEGIKPKHVINALNMIEDKYKNETGEVEHDT